MNIYNVRQLLKTQSIFDIELRVVYYARVSTEREEQKVSIGHQQEYYEDLIKNNPKWKFVGKYVDEGISGISTRKREAFQKMLEDARLGKFDLIITKEISRFARNTLDSIQYTRELLMSGTAVWFQTDNINTLDEDSELRLSIMAAMAQDEIRKLSTRVKFGHARSIKNGVVLGNSMIYGWDKKDGRLTINEKEAEMVRLVFQKYSTGLWTTPQLETYLWEQGYRNHKGGKISRKVIGNMITNPKYKGFYVGGKVKVVDIFTKKQQFLPEKDWVMYKDDGSKVPAIVDEETWEMANKYYASRSNVLKSHASSFKQGNPFTGIIQCGNDGATYWMKGTDGHDDTTWVCSHRIKERAGSCNSFPVRGSELKKILVQVFNRMVHDQDKVVEQYMRFYESTIQSEACATKTTVKNLKQEIAILEQKRDKLLDFNLDGLISDEEFIKRNKEFTARITEKEGELEAIDSPLMPSDEIHQKLTDMLQAAKQYMCLTTEDIDQFVIQETIKKICIQPMGGHKAKIEIYLKNEDLSAQTVLLEDFHEPLRFERISSSSIKTEVVCEYSVQVFYKLSRLFWKHLS